VRLSSPMPGTTRWTSSLPSAALTAVALVMYDSTRFLAADHYGGFAVGLIVILTGLRVLRDASLELMDTMPAEDARDLERSCANALDHLASR
jgi:divalent metal cation (Fe/Co/Zn/Cd) transporter